MVISIFAAIVLALAAVIFAAAPNMLPEDLANSALQSITINGQPATIEALLAARTPVLIGCGVSLLVLILSIVAIGKIRAALGEVRDEKPFSEKCSGSLRTAAILEIINGVIFAGGTIASAVVSKSAVTVESVSNGIVSGLSMLIFAIILMMLAKISEFGSRKSY